MISSRLKRLFLNIAMVACSAILAILIGEAALRIQNLYTQYLVWHPNKVYASNFFGDLLPGLDKGSRFTTNSYGLRGTEVPDTSTFNILTVGGSTTECKMLDDSSTWPHLLQSRLNSSLAEVSIWAGNAGVSGHNSAHHLLHLQEIPRKLPKLDLVIIMVGFNDFSRFLEMGAGYIDPSRDPLLIRKAFRIYPRRKNAKWWQKTEIWMYLRNAKYLLDNRQSGLSDDGKLEMLASKRKHYRESPKTARLPDLSMGLEHFREGLERLVRESEKNGVPILFLTQPSAYYENPSDTDLAQMTPWSIKASNYYEPGQMEKGLERYNLEIKSLASRTDVFVYDISEILPKDTSVFYDDIHFNKYGAERVADLVSVYIRDHIIFKN